MLSNLSFANNNTLLCLFLFFSIIDIYFFIPAVIAQIFNPTTELAILIGMPTDEVKAGFETYSAIIIVEAKLSNLLLYNLFAIVLNKRYIYIFVKFNIVQPKTINVINVILNVILLKVI